MTAILDPRVPSRHGAVDPAAALLADVHALGEQHIAAARHLAAERDFERRWRQSLEVEVAALMHQNRELRKANELWQQRFEDVTRTLELPKYPAAESAPVTPAKRRWWR